MERFVMISRKNNAFTLVEMLICLILTAIVIFFVYTMMISAHRSYAKLFGASKQRDSLRYFEEVFMRSAVSAFNIKVGSDYKTIDFHYFDPTYPDSGDSVPGLYRIDRYTLLDRSNSKVAFSKNEARSKVLDEKDFEVEEDYKNNRVYKLSLQVYKSDKNGSVLGQLTNNEVVLENVSRFYFFINKPNITVIPVPDGSVFFLPYLSCSVVFCSKLSDGEIISEGRTYKYVLRQKMTETQIKNL